MVIIVLLLGFSLGLALGAVLTLSYASKRVKSIKQNIAESATEQIREASDLLGGDMMLESRRAQEIVTILLDREISDRNIL